MIGSELAPYPTYLLERAAEELSVRPRVSPAQLRLAELFIRLFGVPELGVQIRIQHVLRRLPGDVGALVDLGCGAGMLLGAVARGKRYERLVGVEVDGPSAEIARRTHAAAEIVNDRVEALGNAYDGSFDRAVCIDVFEHLPESDLLPFARRAFGLLRPGGTFVVHVPKTEQVRHFDRFRAWGHADHERDGFAPGDLTSLLCAAGFRIRELAPTVNSITSYCWELNMLVAGSARQAPVFPLTLALCTLAERLPFRRGNGVLCVAERPREGL